LDNILVSPSISSKIVPPEPYGLVARHRLFKEIGRAPPRSLVWITAPPGAGKSSIATAWLHFGFGPALQGHGVWYRLDETDADPCLFFQCLKRAIAHLPDVSVDALPDLTPEGLSDLREYAENWFELLLSNEARPPYLFIFDDIHHLAPDAPVLSLLPILAERLRPRDQVLCLSRQEPPASVVAALPKSRLSHITDLRVQADEFQDFKRDLRSFEEVTESAFLTQLRRSGHWITDLVVAPSSRLPLRRLAAHPVPEFTEFFSGYGEEEQKGLLATAFLQVGQEEEWYALGGSDAVTAMVRLAEERSLVTRLVNGALRKHDLLQEWLTAAAVVNLPPDNLCQVRLRTGRLLIERDELLAGAQLLAQADAFDEMTNLVLERAQALLGAGQNREVLQLIEMLPEHRRAEPAIRGTQAYALLPFEPQAARANFAALWRSLDPAAEASLYTQAVYGEVRAALADWSVDRRLLTLVEQTGPALERIGGAPEPIQLQLKVGRSLALLLGEPTHPDVPSAQAELERILPLLPSTIQLSAGSLLANYFLAWRGDLAAGRVQVDTLRPLVGRADIPPLSTLSWYYAAATVAFRDADGEALRRLAGEAQAFAHKWGISHRLSTVYWVLAQALAAEGRQDEAAVALHQYERIIKHSQRVTSPGPHTLRAALALSAGQHEQAIAEARVAYNLAFAAGSSQEIGNQISLLALALAATGHEGAQASIDELQELAGQTRNAVFALHATLADAYLAHAQGRMNDFVAAWERTAKAACAVSFRRLSGMNTASLSRLANAALGQGADVAVTRRLIELWSLLPPEAETIDEKWPFPVEIECLGGFAIKINGEKIRDGQGKAQRKPLELLWSLIPACEQGVSQDLLADQLWPELDGDRAMHTLRTTVYRLRKLIGTDAILQEDDHIRLNPKHVATDFGRLLAALSRLRTHHLSEVERMAAFDQALRLYRGPYLLGVAIDQVLEERERLERIVVNKAIGFLMALDPKSPATLLRVHRLQTVFPHVRLPDAIAQLWPSEARVSRVAARSTAVVRDASRGQSVGFGPQPKPAPREG
jgi:LuxR family maltose regulon positive regulatory protein